MIDCEAIWRAAKRIPRPAAFGGVLDDDLFRLAPIMSRTGGDAGPLFDLHPRPELAGPKNWHFLVPVRTGGDFFPLDEARAVFRGDMNLVDSARSLWALTQGDLIDLVAVSCGMDRVIGRLTGLALALGAPVQQCGFWNDQTVRVHRTVRSWLANRLDGIVLVGTERENCDFLHGADKIIADDFDHGNKLAKMLRKPYTGPNVMVAA
jgi:hypothetical protein